ncbi:MAG: RluA family pseudouridine synthase, partial [Candidatus Omnitrophica bacterium]|nr:RluA family pseudouridine synthase [Candidatus Omnitrophota bacterium]
GFCLSREQIKKLILNKGVFSENKSQLKPHYKVKDKDSFNILIEEKKEVKIKPEKIDLEVIYESFDFAIINKPSGLVVHPGAGTPEHTLVNALVYRFKELSDINPLRPGIVHRLDKETSGIMIIAKDNFFHLELTKQFSKRQVKKKYVALVKGRVEFDEDIIEVPIGRSPYQRKKMYAGFLSEAKYAQTFYRTLRRKDNLSLLELSPLTGRTHQLRVHLAFLGHPILGDTKYGKEKNFPRLALHAFYLGFYHPKTKKFLEFSLPIPEEFLKPFK